MPERMTLATQLRVMAVIDLREKSGLTFWAIGAMFGVTEARALQLYQMAQRIGRRSQSNSIYRLSTRARNILARLGAPETVKPEDVRSRIKTGFIRLHRIRGCGHGTQAEIKAWAGLEEA